MNYFFKLMLAVLAPIVLVGGWQILVMWLCEKGHAPEIVTFALLAVPFIVIVVCAMRETGTPRFHPGVRPPTSGSSQRVTRR